MSDEKIGEDIFMEECDTPNILSEYEDVPTPYKGHLCGFNCGSGKICGFGCY